MTAPEPDDADGREAVGTPDGGGFTRSRSTSIPSATHADRRREAGGGRGIRPGGDSDGDDSPGGRRRRVRGEPGGGGLGRRRSRPARRPASPPARGGAGPRGVRRDRRRLRTSQEGCSYGAVVERGAARGRDRRPARQRAQRLRTGTGIQRVRRPRRNAPGIGQPRRGGASGLPGRRGARRGGAPSCPLRECRRRCRGGRGQRHVQFAFREAHVRHCRLVAVHAWSAPLYASATPRALPSNTPETRWRSPARVLDDALRGASERYRDAPVNRRVIEGSARHALLGAAVEADLLVVGARRRQGHLGLQLGLVNHAVLHHAPCPVAVVPRI